MRQLFSIAVMTLLINSRHLMYGLSYPIERVRGGLAKFYTVYTLIDEAYALNTGPDRHKPAWFPHPVDSCGPASECSGERYARLRAGCKFLE